MGKGERLLCVFSGGLGLAPLTSLAAFLPLPTSFLSSSRSSGRMKACRGISMHTSQMYDPRFRFELPRPDHHHDSCRAMAFSIMLRVDYQSAWDTYPQLILGSDPRLPLLERRIRRRLLDAAWHEALVRLSTIIQNPRRHSLDHEQSFQFRKVPFSLTLLKIELPPHDFMLRISSSAHTSWLTDRTREMCTPICRAGWQQRTC